MRNQHYWVAVGGLLLIGAPAAHAADNGQFSLSTGANYTSGKYGTDTTTDIWSVPFTAEYQNDRWTMKLTVPYISISGAGNVIPGVGQVVNSNPHGRGRGLGHTVVTGGGTTTTTTSGSASGLGDVVASAGYEVYHSADHSFGLDLTGKIKFGTADENKGLGTGKDDYGLSVDTYKVMGDWTAFGGVGWMKYGSSQYIRLKNGANANVGMDYRFSRNDDFGAYYYYRQKIASNGGPQSELTAYWNHRLGGGWRLQSYVLGGFANGSPDYGVGASVKYSF
ncbi:transporter [Dyella sp. A6]|uniref:transporter n=1 Tax=Dyella aluminiiresistens TaxID=3069105 RepID=UPI002E77CF2A|nr:transporter [Dyella sp. A6]